LRDVGLLQQISRRSTAAVSLSITTFDDELAHHIEPCAPPPPERFLALRALADAGLEARVALMPVLPFLEDSPDNVRAIVERAKECGVRAIAASFGVTLRDRQRAHFYARLDESFPAVRARYEARYADRYACSSSGGDALRLQFEAICAKHDIRTSIRPLLAPSADEPGLFA
jgi:DNA repair photolyase